MSTPLSVTELLSDLAADATTIGFDMPGGLYDKLHTFIEARTLVPKGKTGKIAVAAALLLASRIVKQKRGAVGPVESFFHEITNDGIREQVKRVLESGKESTTSPTPPHKSSLGQAALLQLDKKTQKRFLSRFRAMSKTDQKRMRDQMGTSTTADLATIADLEPEDASTVLDLLQNQTEQRSTSK